MEVKWKGKVKAALIQCFFFISVSVEKGHYCKLHICSKELLLNNSSIDPTSFFASLSSFLSFKTTEASNMALAKIDWKQSSTGRQTRKFLLTFSSKYCRARAQEIETLRWRKRRRWTRPT